MTRLWTWAYAAAVICRGICRVSPQPWLYFSPGHSFLEQELPDVDARVVEALHRNHVSVIILEKDSWAKNQNLWKRMPKLAAWIDADFETIKEFGIYDVRVSRDTVF